METKEYLCIPMCYNHRLKAEAREVEKQFNAIFGEYFNDYEPMDFYNGFTYPKTPVIANDRPDHIQLFQWGLIPSWAKDDKEFRKTTNTLNAKLETMTDKPAFRGSVKNRCLILSDAFYEWQWLDEKGKKKLKHEISLAGNQVFAFAGIWSPWKNSAGLVRNTYSIITTEANALMAEIHNSAKRMPFILRPDQYQDWLHGNDVEVEMNLPLEAIPITNQGSLF